MEHCISKFRRLIFLVILFQLEFEIVRTQNVDKSVPESETFLTETDFMIGHYFARSADTERTDYSKMFNKNLFEGDIANKGLNSRNVENFVNGKLDQSLGMGIMRNALRNRYMLWRDAIIPYTISTKYTREGKAKIAAAFETYARLTCIKFVPKQPNHRDYIHIMPENGCYSLVGREGGRQIVSIDEGCFERGTILHELMHTAGFFHEQSRNDRDEYVKIYWQNIQDGLEDQFEKYSLKIIDHLGTEYDYSSVMHYPETAFSRNGQPTIVPKQPGVTIGQRLRLSDNDVLKLNILYMCDKNPTEPRTIKPRPPVTPKPKPKTTTEGPSENCVDLWHGCDLLAWLGQCKFTLTEDMMKKNCAKTCQKCNEKVVDPNCKDERPWCEDWSERGLCDNFFYETYMTDKCQKSCGYC